jgi:predicted nuclease of predicted toxin-antitoxin system
MKYQTPLCDHNLPTQEYATYGGFIREFGNSDSCYIILDEHLPPRLGETLEVILSSNHVSCIVDCVIRPLYIINELRPGMSDEEIKDIAGRYAAYIATKNVRHFKDYPRLIRIPPNGGGKRGKECVLSQAILKEQSVAVLQQLVADLEGPAFLDYKSRLYSLELGGYDYLFL